MGARRHHFVSQCYLKSFAVSRKREPQTTVFDGFERKTYRTSIGNIGAERDFNRIEVEGHDPNVMENALASFEAELGPALDRIIATRSLSNEDDRASLLNFMCLLALRNPRLRETMRSAQDQAARMLMDRVLSSKKSYESELQRARADGFVSETQHVPYEEMKKLFEDGSFKIEVPTERHVKMELELFPKILPLFFRRGWLLLKAPDRSAGFITSDHPVCLMWSDPSQRNSFYGPGFGLPGTDVFFPVSPGLAMIGAFELKDDERTIAEDGVAAINGAIATYAERQVYTRDGNFVYSTQPNMPPRKANKLLGDNIFKRPRKKEDTTEDLAESGTLPPKSDLPPGRI
jgi:Protein of unknown function (DUF4238)